VGIDIDAQGNIYVADTWNRRVQKFGANSLPLAQWEVVNGWQSETVVNKPYLAVDKQGRVFISDPEGYRIIVYDSNGQCWVHGAVCPGLGLVALPKAWPSTRKAICWW
jgi:sugar lactone lactonase YvrE